MSDKPDVISGLATRIVELRSRLSELDAERTRILNELDDCTARFSAIAAGEDPPSDTSARMDLEIKKLFRRHYDRHFSPKEIAEYLVGLGWKVDMQYVRTKLPRLAKRGKIRKVGHGRYMNRG